MDDLDLYPVAKSEVVSKIVDQEAVLVLPAQGTLKVLNDIGAQIWVWIDGSRSVRQIAGLLCEAYEVEQAQAETDTLEFLRSLADKGAVRFAGSPIVVD